MAEGAAGGKRAVAARPLALGPPRLPLWAPVALGAGVWLPLEGLWRPGWALPLAVALGLMALRALLRAHTAGAALGLAAAFLIGAAACEARIGAVAAPVLEGRWTGALEGRVIDVSRARSGAPRVVLDRLGMEGLHASAVPERVRVTLSGVAKPPAPGRTVRLRPVLGPPKGPAAPGAFDFSRQAWFARLGGIGYARGRVEVAPGFDDDALTRLNRFRMELGERLRRRMPGEEGAVAAALVVGDRTGLGEATREALRGSGLAHLLAISGLHVGLVSALVFGGLRLGLASVPGLAGRFPIRKAAAVGGLAAAAAYLALAGFGVATQRAFVMAAVAFGAILMDRRAVTMRSLAAAACLVLVWRPESLAEPGFRMSFAAVAALVAAYEATRWYWQRGAGASWARRVWRGALGLAMTSAVAGAATAPFAAWHFGRVASYALAANLAAMPVMALWIVPCLLVALALAPFGAEGAALEALGWGIGWILAVAHEVAGWPGAVRTVPAAAPGALALVVAGGLWLVIREGRGRLAGAAVIAAGLAWWPQARPWDVVATADGALVAGRTAEGALWLSRGRASSFAAELWLLRDGDTGTQEEAHARRRWRCSRWRCEGWSGAAGRRVVLLRRARPGPGDCAPGTVLIAPRHRLRHGACLGLGAETLAGASSVAVRWNEEGPRVAIARPYPVRLGLAGQ